ncbi:MAG: GNAT family N-acetyltransferase [Bacillota bacterium]
MVKKTIIGVRDNKKYLEKATDYFSAKWGIERNIYADCISSSITTESPLPRWYLMLKRNQIIGGCGLITNDFISRRDLYPWLCTLFIEENERGNNPGAKLLAHGNSYRYPGSNQGHYNWRYLSL